MIEVEIKARISNPDDMRSKFKQANGKYRLTLFHEDTYYNMPKKLRNFQKTDEALRIRKSTELVKSDNKNEEKLTSHFITYKGKKIDTLTKSRNELEVKIEDGEKLKEILIELGFREIFTVKKERELYEFVYKNNNIEALIDYIPFLKEYFIEVELHTESVQNLEEATEILFDFLSLFNIQKEESIRESYLELIANRFKGKIKN